MLAYRTVVCHAAVAAGICIAAPVRAGIPECDHIRIESFHQCEVQINAGCEASCELDIYKKACATRRYRSCHEECAVPPTTVCTGDCTAQCAELCNVGIDVVCRHNCFPECVDDCAEHCDDPQDARCRASCEATCDGECTSQCADIPEGSSCFTHCQECCGGTCRAVAGMDCQISCQDREFEQCEYEMQGQCMGSCSADGALFCNGEFIASGRTLLDCAAALVEIDIELTGDVDSYFESTDNGFQAGVDGTVGASIDELDSDVSEALHGAGGGCSAGGDDAAGGSATALMALAALGLSQRRRRRRR